jgi:anti-sigma regulatory factor (Ser/Thr protein kinase)
MTALTLSGRPESARAAREFAAGCLAGCPSSAEAVLCVDELVVNAVQHSRSGLPGGTIEVRIAVAAGEWLRIEVQDAGPLVPAVPAQRGPLDEAGRGLALVVGLADVFGTDGSGLYWAWMSWDSEASHPAPWPPIQIPAQLRKPAVPCEVRARGLHHAGGVS